MKLNIEELQILQTLDECVRHDSARKAIDSIVKRVEQQLAKESNALMAWEPVPLKIYAKGIPGFIQSSWVFILRANTTSGAERHPNSHQRVMSYRRSADLQVWEREKWKSNILVSEPSAPLEKRWLSIPTNVWHQAVIPMDNWIVVSFHTVPAEELIEERPRADDLKLTHQRKYMNGKYR